jgi:hypothetical protein
VARVIFGLHIRFNSHRLCGIHGEGVAVALKQETTALVADHGTTLRLQNEMSRTALPHFTSSALTRNPLQSSSRSVSHECWQW